MNFHSTLRPLTALLLALPASAQEMRTDEHLIATLPEDISLECEPLVDPNGESWPVIHEVVYSPDGNRVAYIGERNGKTHPVIDEEVFDAYHYISRPTFDETGQNVLFRLGNRKKKNTEVWWLMVNGETFGKQDWIGEPAISPDGTRVAYWTQPGAKVVQSGAYNRSDQVLMVATRKGTTWKTKKGAKWDDALSLSPPQCSADGSRVSTLAMDKGKWFVLQVTKKEKKLGKGESMLTAFSTDAAGKNIACVALSNSSGAPGGMPGGPPGALPFSKSVVKWGKLTLGEKFETIASPVHSASGKHLAYKGFEGERMGIVLDDEDELVDPHEYVHRPVFSPDAKRIAYCTTEGGQLDDFYRKSEYGDHYIEGGTSRVLSRATRGKRKPERGAEWLEIRDLCFSPDGEHLAYAARSEEGWCCVLDEAPRPFSSSVGPPHFNASGTHLGHGARTDSELWWKVRPVG